MSDRLSAMAQYQASARQLRYLEFLGDTHTTPKNMAEASERIDQLLGKETREDDEEEM